MKQYVAAEAEILEPEADIVCDSSIELPEVGD